MGSTLTGMYGGTSKFFEGKKMQKRAQKHIDEFEFSELNNVQEDRQVSTRSAELRTEQGDIQSATSTEALRAGGTRALVGGLGRVEANRNIINREVGANLDMQEKQIQGAIAQDNAAIRGMKERRESAELAGYGQMLNTGMGMKYQGITDVYNAQAAAEDKAIKVAGMVTGGGLGGASGGK